MRDRIMAQLKDAMRAKDSVRLSTLRLLQAAIKDQDIAKRTADGDGQMSDAEILALMAKMLKQREDSARTYEEAGRVELAEQERAEQVVIREFMPKQMSDDEVEAAIAKVIAEQGASSIRDMGKVMGALKEAYAGQMDFGAAGPRVKAALG